MALPPDPIFWVGTAVAAAGAPPGKAEEVAAGAPGSPGFVPLLVMPPPTGALDVAKRMVGAEAPGCVLPAVFNWMVGAGFAAVGAFDIGVVAFGGAVSGLVGAGVAVGTGAPAAGGPSVLGGDGGDGGDGGPPGLGAADGLSPFAGML